MKALGDTFSKKMCRRLCQILWMSKLRKPNRGHAGYREVRGLLREARAEHRQSSLQRQENLHRQSWSDFKHIDCKVYQNAVQKYAFMHENW